MAMCTLRFLPALAAWLLLITCTAFFFYYLCPYLEDKFNFPVRIFQGIISMFVVINFLLAEFMDPGRLTKGDPDEYKDEDPAKAPYMKVVQIDNAPIRMKWCTTCNFYRPPRTSHCSLCNVCVVRHDHHCPYINNCIGQENYRFFFFFLVFLSCHMITIFGWSTVYLIHHKEKLRETDCIVALSLFIIIFFLIWPIVGLTAFHCCLAAKNKTTNEQMTGKYKSGENPFNKGCRKNIPHILCGPHLPKCKHSSIEEAPRETGCEV